MNYLCIIFSIIYLPIVKFKNLTSVEINEIINNFDDNENHFKIQGVNNFKSTYCEEYITILAKNATEEITSFYYPALTNYLYHRCNNERCILSKYWNETNINKIDDDTFFEYISLSTYILSPTFLLCIMSVCIVSFLNCLYCNYCYCCCFKYESRKRNETYFITLIVVISILMFCFIIVSVLCESSFKRLKLFSNYIMCQFGTTNIFKLYEAKDYTKKDENIDIEGWYGIKWINQTFDEYSTNLEDFQNNTIMNNQFIILNDSMQSYYENVKKKFDEFSNYQLLEPFLFEDTNGATIQAAKRSYRCNICKNTDKTNKIFQEIETQYKKWQEVMNDFKKTLFDNFKDQEGWNKLKKMHSDTKQSITIILSKIFQFYNETETFFTNQINSRIENNKQIEISVLIFVLLSFILIILGYLLVNKSIKKVNEETDKENYAFKKPEEKLLVKKIKFRWMFHIVINIFFIGILVFNILSLTYFYWSFLIFEGTSVLELNIFNKTLVKNINSVYIGDIVDICKSDKSIENLFGFKKYENFFENIKKASEHTIFKYNKTPVLELFNEFEEYTKSLKIDSYEDKDNPKIKWDIDGEQINYYLFPLKQYKYFTPPIQTLRQFTDYYFIDSIYENYQLKYCKRRTSKDIWTNSQISCNKIFHDYKFKQSLSTLNEDEKTCFSISTEEQNCIAGDTPSCYVKFYMNRYKKESDFSDCEVPLAERGDFSSKQWFISKINGYLLYAKNAEFLQISMENKLIEYKEKFKTSIIPEVKIYGEKLSQLNNSLVSVYNGLKIMSDYFFFTISEKNIHKNLLGQLKCEFIESEYSKLFKLIKSTFAEELFGMGLMNMIRTVILFLNTCMIVILFIKLRSNIEKLNIKIEKETIKAMNLKELKYFNSANNYIETEDKFEYSEVKKLDEKDQKNNIEKSNNEDQEVNKIHSNISNKMVEFINKQLDEYQKRNNINIKQND